MSKELDTELQCIVNDAYDALYKYSQHKIQKQYAPNTITNEERLFYFKDCFSSAAQEISSKLLEQAEKF